MAVADCIRSCRHCGNDFRRTGKGQPTKYCDTRCRDMARGWAGKWRKTNSPGKPCSIVGCESLGHTRGLCVAHYSRTRQGRPIDAPIARKGARVEKPCGWCGKMMTLKISIAKHRECCSRSCGMKLRARAEGKRPMRQLAYCVGCGKACCRRVRNHKDAGKYCSRECYQDIRAKVSSEKGALDRIRRNNKPVVQPKPEVNRLERTCCDCMSIFTQRTHWGMPELRCQDCKLAHTARQKSEYRKTPAYQSMRRAAKSRRRARTRGVEHEAIDPIKVFERDKWRCHLCGCKTHRGKRGTCDPKAPELDHVVTLSEGGAHTWGNVACSCRACNGAKGARSMGQLGLGIAA